MSACYRTCGSGVGDDGDDGDTGNGGGSYNIINSQLHNTQLYI
jgi:hypothetical protein